jgi:hypothetical protein
MRVKNNNFNVRAKHANMYLVQLPPWLPSQVLLDMVNLFEGYLLDELLAIDKMIKSQSVVKGDSAKTHSPTGSIDSIYSIESDAAMSSSSAESAAPSDRGFPEFSSTECLVTHLR